MTRNNRKGAAHKVSNVPSSTRAEITEVAKGGTQTFRQWEQEIGGKGAQE